MHAWRSLQIGVVKRCKLAQACAIQVGLAACAAHLRNMLRFLSLCNPTCDTCLRWQGAVSGDPGKAHAAFERAVT